MDLTEEDIVVKNLKGDFCRSVRYAKQSDDPEYRRRVGSILSVLEYYMPSEDYEKWYKTVRKDIEELFGDGSVSAEVTEEHEDGSVTVEVQLGSIEDRDELLQAGILYMMLKGHHSARDEDIFRWVRLGKELDSDKQLVCNVWNKLNLEKETNK